MGGRSWIGTAQRTEFQLFGSARFRQASLMTGLLLPNRVSKYPLSFNALRRFSASPIGYDKLSRMITGFKS
jgi:hypothetical protein